MGMPVIDSTGIGGTFDIKIDASVPPREIEMPPGLSSLPIFQNRSPDSTGNKPPPDELMLPGLTIRRDATPLGTALQKLGLKLDRSREMIPILIIDSVDKKPTEN
jgi:uncharacterized protein (TIGR03435 family)